MKKIVIVGSSFGGLTAAFELRRLLSPREAEILVVSKTIFFLSPEPFLGHFGMGGMGGRQFLELEFEKRDIAYVCSAAIARITAGAVELADGKRFDSTCSMVIPPLAGVEAVSGTPGLANPKGFVPVDPYYRHEHFPAIFAVGVAIALPPVGETPVPVNFPKTGHMTEQMARLAAENIAAAIAGRSPISKDLGAVCVMDLGDRAAMMSADPVRPPRNITRFSEGKGWLWMKRTFAKYYV